MQPLYNPGTIVLGLRGLRPKIGRVVVAEYQGRELIKRIADVNERGIYLLGDNAPHSTDSRTYGWFPPSQVKSVVIWSFKR